MTSSDSGELPDFERATQTTAEDVAALERARQHNRLGPVEYLAFLIQFSKLHPPTREIPARHEPFRL